jgi:hypothetical protein
MLNELKVFNFFKTSMILYLTVADGLNNPVRLQKLYSKHVLIRLAYTLFGAFNVFGSTVGMDLGFKTSILVTAMMMVLLDLIPKYMRNKDEKNDVPFTPFLSANKQSYIAIGVLVYLYTSDFKIES